MRVTFLSFLFPAALALLAPHALAQPTPPGAEIRVEPEVAQALGDGSGRARPATPRASRANAIALERASDEEIAQRMSPPRKGAPLQVGFGRDIAATRTPAGLRAMLTWEPLPGRSQVAAISLSSPGASAVRVGMEVNAIPPAAIFRFYAPDSEDMFEVRGAEILETISRNFEAGESHAEARMYWAPAVEAETAIVEIELPADAKPEDLHLAVPQVSHLVASVREDFTPKASSTCQLDATCYSSTWGTEMNAVARMTFVVSGGTYVCSGTLVADRDTSTVIPYFLSANHCINTQTVASTLQTLWFYRSPSCNAGTYNYTALAGGATLLYNSATTDTSFMRLNNTPPAGVTYAGWLIGTPPGLNTALTGIHHPKGDPQKISFASLYMYATCTPGSNGTFSCATASSGTGTFFGVRWTQGLTEGGSSGSGLFLNNGHYLIGQLYGGSSECNVSNGPDFYGRFDTAYNAGLSQWLSPVSRTLTITKTGTGTGTVTSSPSGINCGGTCSATYLNGTSVTLTATPSSGSTFGGWTGACFGTGSCTVNLSGDYTVTATFSNASLTPGAPQNLAATPGSGQATFTFQPPTNTGGSAISLYTVTCNTGQFGTGTASPITVTGLQNGTTYVCSATATNATTTGPASANVSVTPAVGPLALSSVVSRKNHGFGTFDLDIDPSKPVNGAITVEPRADNTHRIVFRFNNPVTSAGVVTVNDVNGAAIGAATVALAGSEITVTLAGVDGRRVRVALQGVNGSLNAAASAGFLAGDVDSSGAVTASDLLRIRGRVGQAAAAATFRYDDDLDTSVTNFDLSGAKQRSGTMLQ